uniref:Uncharacterized protein n=1 Tax=viral metagenome TaxID=1070528 RepID=A0A6C0E3L0_9ZZZZ
MEYENTKQNEVAVKQVMKSIEQQAEKMVLLGYKTGHLVMPDKINDSSYKPTSEQLEQSTSFLRGIMQQGANEFEKKIGRPMTYSEMREMYG